MVAPSIRAADRRDGGQILVIFALSPSSRSSGWSGSRSTAAAPIAQRRDQQTAADLAALAGANDYLMNNNSSQAIARARTFAGDQRLHGRRRRDRRSTSRSTRRTASRSRSTSTRRTGTRSSARSGMPNWHVSDDGHARWPASRTPRPAPAPFIFSIGAFNNDGTPKYQTSTDFGETNGDVPTSDLDFAWTNYGTGNVNTSARSATSSTGDHVINKTLDYGEYIGQHNNGNHTPCTATSTPTCPAWRCRSRSSTPTATSWAGRCSTSTARPAARTSTSTATS